MSEEDLINGCILQDKTSQELLYQRYAGKMLSVSRGYTQDDVAAKNILQDAFTKVFNNIEKFEFKGSLEGWIRRIVVNTAKDQKSTMSEEDLIKGCILENRKSQELLYQRYAGKMLSVSRRYAFDEMKAEDILQDAFIKVFNNIEKFKFKGSFEGWIRRIVVNTALKKYKKLSFQKEEIGISDAIKNTQPPIDSDVLDKLGYNDLIKLINELPKGYRIVFKMYAIEGYSHKEIGEMLKIQESTSRSQLMKARKELQTKILSMESITL